MGAWRKIYVDDRLPMDLLKHVMLPSLSMPDTSKEGEIEKQKVKIVELWPFLLAKALLKIASLSWYEDREMVDFDIVECLTGWHPQRINTKGNLVQFSVGIITDTREIVILGHVQNKFSHC